MATKIADAPADPNAARRLQAANTQQAERQQPAPPTGPRSVAVDRTGGPKGARIVRFFGVGNLRSNVQVESIKAGVAIYCGRMTGIAYGVQRHPNSKDSAKTSLCFTGRFINVQHDGAVVESLGAYLPSSVERAFAGMLESGAAQSVSFALEVWAEPDAVTGRKSAQGYSYAAHDMTPKREQSDPALALAIAAGVIEGVVEPSPRQIGYDPETGEVPLEDAPQGA